jgi:hypothetical protein
MEWTPMQQRTLRTRARVTSKIYIYIYIYIIIIIIYIYISACGQHEIKYTEWEMTKYSNNFTYVIFYTL